MISDINQVNGNVDPPSPAPAEAEGTDSVRLFEANKRLLAQLGTAREQLAELEALVNPVVNFKLVVDCDDRTLARMCTAGWSPKFVSSAPRPGILGASNGVSPVVVTVMFERIVPDRPTPPRKLMVPEVMDDPQKTESTEQEDADSEKPAAKIEHVVELPTISLLPTHDKAELNRIAVMNAARRTQEMFRGFARSTRPVDVVEGSLA